MLRRPSLRVLVTIGSGLLSLVAWRLGPAHADIESSGLDLQTSPLTAGGSGSVSPTGGYSQALAIDLPPARGGMTPPLAVVYTGSAVVGAAGVGWDVPLSYVEVVDNLSRHKPVTATELTLPPPTASAPARVYLHLGSSEMLMVPGDKTGVYRATVADGYAELQSDRNGHWLYRTGAGWTYTFETFASASDSSRAYLTRIDDLSGHNPIVFHYAVLDSALAPGSNQAVAKEILLTQVDYNFNVTQTCARDQILLDYLQQAFPPAQPPLALTIDEGHVHARTRVLSAIEVWEHETEACSSDPTELVRSYELGYDSDADTGLPRLVQANQRGAGVAPFGPGPSLPLVGYVYGQASVADGALEFVTSGTTADLPDVPDTLRGGVAGLFFDYALSLYSVLGFRDLTGDGMPDFFFPGPSFFTGSQTFHAVRNVASASASGVPTFAGELVDQTNPRWPIGWASNPTNERYENTGNFYMPTTVTWAAMLDMNGDGVPDLVDSRSGRNPQGQPDANYWAVRLYRPQDGSGSQAFVDTNVDISGLRTEVAARHHNFDMGAEGAYIEDYNPQHYLPIERSQRVRIYSQSRCFDYRYESGDWVRHPCAHPPPFVVQHSATLTEWTVQDVNGDHLPDFLLNSESIESFDENTCPTACPERVHPDSGESIPFGCEGYCEDRVRGLDFAHPDQNQILVFYNDGFALRGGAAAASTVKWNQSASLLRDHASCGLERRRNDDFRPDSDSDHDDRHTQFLECGFVDANGDGIRDYVTTDLHFHGGIDPNPDDTRFLDYDPFESTVYLGTGVSDDFTAHHPEFTNGASPSAFGRLRAIKLPGVLELLRNSQDRCRGPGHDDFFLAQATGLTDLTGDGLPDYIFFGSWEDTGAGPKITSVRAPLPNEPVSSDSWWAMTGTGTGFRRPVPIRVLPSAGGVQGAFGLRFVTQKCQNPFEARVIFSLADLDGDGRTDIVNGHASSGDLIVARLRGGGGDANPLGAGRLVRVTNGYGAAVDVTYGSAKSDTTTRHLLPYPEVVVTELAESATRFGGPREPVRFAYGDAAQTYDPLRGRWVFPGYGRRVSLSGNASGGTFVGQAEVSDTWRPSDLPAIDRYAISGREKTTTFLAGIDDRDPRKLLAADPLRSAKAHGGRSLTWVRAALAESGVAPAPAEDCADIIPLVDTPTGDAKLCRHDGVVLQSVRIGWEGSSGPGAATAITTQTSLANVDALGRPTRTHDFGDTAVGDDDTCDEFVYATPAAGIVMTQAVASFKRTDCDRTTIASSRFRYGALSEGSYAFDQPLTVTTDRRETVHGAILATLTGDVTTPDVFGNPVRHVRTRADGVTETEVTAYDVFGARVHTLTRQASDVAISLVSSWDYDAIHRSTTYTDEQSNRWRVALDPFGRETDTSELQGTSALLLSRLEYGDDPAAADGRSVTRSSTQSFDGVTPAVIERELLDDFGNVRSFEQLLGDDYSGNHLVTREVDLDAQGRPRFVADPYARVGSTPANNRYGTTYLYGSDGRLRCRVRGVELQTSSTPSATDDRYPTCADYVYANHQQQLRFQGSDDLTSGSPAFGTVEAVIRTALGREVSRQKGTSNATLERVDYTYDRLGNRLSVKRFADPTSPTSVVAQSTYVYDSLGQVITATEGANASEKRSYDDWGNLIGTEWSKPSGWVSQGVRYTYDGFGRQTSEQLTRRASANAPVEVTREISYHYDTAAADDHHIFPTNLKGRLAYVVAPSRITYLGYDEDGRASVVTRADRDVENPPVYTELSSYGPSGQLQRLTFLLPDTDYNSESAVYYYDSAGRMRETRWEVDGDDSGPALFHANTVDALGRYRDVTYGNGARQRWTYRGERRNELTAWSIEDASGTFTTAFGPYDGEGRRTYEDATFNGATRHRAFDYDALDRVKQVRTTTPLSIALESEAFTYDGLGNLRQSVTLVGPVQTIRRYLPATDDPDRICREETVRGSSTLPTTTGCTHSYDDLGNVRQVVNQVNPFKTLEYNADGRVSRIVSSPVQAELSYDGLGGVAQVWVNGPSVGSRQDRRYGKLIERSHYDSAGELIERRVPGPFGILVTRRGSGPDAIVLYHHGDAHGLQHVTDAVGGSPQHLRYTAFGGISQETGTPGDPTYTKYQWNEGDVLTAIGVSVVGARVYDATSGRFLQREPLPRIGGGASQHPYAFAQNDPINLVDPSGLTTYDADQNQWRTDEWDSLESVADDTGFSTDEIKALNPGLHSHELIERGTTLVIPQTVRIKAFQLAAQHLESTAYAAAATLGGYGPGANKCNIFLNDMYTAAGGNFPIHHGSTPRQWFLRTFGPWNPAPDPALAEDLAGHGGSIAPLRMLDPSKGEEPKIGDVVANLKGTHVMMYAGKVNIVKNGLDARILGAQDAHKQDRAPLDRTWAFKGDTGAGFISASPDGVFYRTWNFLVGYDGDRHTEKFPYHYSTYDEPPPLDR